MSDDVDTGAAAVPPESLQATTITGGEDPALLNNANDDNDAVTTSAGAATTQAAGGSATTPTAAKAAVQVTGTPSVATGGAAAASSSAVNVTARARRRREEAVRRLVADIQARPDRKLDGTASNTSDTNASSGGVGPSHHLVGAASSTSNAASRDSQDWLIASTVAASLERGLDRDLHHELVQEAKENAGRIGQVCHDHSDVFLASVGKVVALGGPSADLAHKLTAAQIELEAKTAGPMHSAALVWEEARDSHARACALQVMVRACHKVAVHLEKARQQASLGRPRGALEAVDEARTALTAPMAKLFEINPANNNGSGGATKKQMEHAAEILKAAAAKKKMEEEKKEDAGGVDGSGMGGGTSGGSSKGIMSLEETPFGRRASLMLPKIENEVLMGARRGLNRWFLGLRSGGDGAKAGRAALRRCAHSMAVGPGNLGLGGHMPPAYLWRAKVCDNLISRMNQNGRVVRSVRLGYWFERDAPKESQRLETTCPPGMERRAEGKFSVWH
jgi:exocyst complex component 6